MELKEVLEKHKLWLNGKGGERADLRSADLHSSDLHEANLREATLRCANLYGVNLRGVNLYSANLHSADLRYADLRYADLRYADLRETDLRSADLYGGNLYGADLRGADLREADLREADLRGSNLREVDLRGADLRSANLSNSKGLLKPSKFLNRLKKTDVGIIAYKVFSENYEPNKKWIIKPKSIIKEVCNFDRTISCACGVNVATKEWILSHTGENEIWRCLIKWEWLADVCVPYNTDGKFRCEKIQLLKVMSREELIRGEEK